MTIISDLMAFNQEFVAQKQYLEFLPTGPTDHRIVVLTCMDTRLVELLPKALNLKNGDAKLIKNAGAILTQPFGSAMRSILVAIYELEAKEVLVIGHQGCGMTNLDHHSIVGKFAANGIPDSTLNTLENSGIHMDQFFKGFNCPEDGVQHSVGIIRNHPLLPPHIPVHGFIIHPETGLLTLINDGYRV